MKLTRSVNRIDHPGPPHHRSGGSPPSSPREVVLREDFVKVLPDDLFRSDIHCCNKVITPLRHRFKRILRPGEQEEFPGFPRCPLSSSFSLSQSLLVHASPSAEVERAIIPISFLYNNVFACADGSRRPSTDSEHYYYPQAPVPVSAYFTPLAIARLMPSFMMTALTPRPMYSGLTAMR